MLRPFIELADEPALSAQAMFAKGLRASAAGSSAPGRAAPWLAAEVRAFYEQVVEADAGGGPASPRRRNAFIREALATPAIATDWSGLPVTLFMAGAFLHHVWAGPPHQLPNENWTTDRNAMAAWFFFRFATWGSNDRWVTPAQQRALAAHLPSEPGATVAQALGRALGEGDLAPGRQDWPAYLATQGSAPEGPPCRSATLSSAAGHELDAEDCLWFGESGQAEDLVANSTWFPPEVDQRWTREGFGLLSLPVSDRATAVPLRLEAELVVPDRDERRQWLTVVVGDRTVYDATSVGFGLQRVRMPLGRLPRGARSLSVSFHSAAYSPLDDGVPDSRRLGVGLRRLWLREVV